MLPSRLSLRIFFCVLPSACRMFLSQSQHAGRKVGHGAHTVKGLRIHSHGHSDKDAERIRRLIRRIGYDPSVLQSDPPASVDRTSSNQLEKLRFAKKFFD